MGNVRRIYVEKKAPFAVKAKELKGDLKNYLNLKKVEDVRMFIRYDAVSYTHLPSSTGRL